MSAEIITDEVEKGLLELLAAGDVEIVGKGPTGENRWALTAQGKKRAEDMLREHGIDPDAVKGKASR